MRSLSAAAFVAVKQSRGGNFAHIPTHALHRSSKPDLSPVKVYDTIYTLQPFECF